MRRHIKYHAKLLGNDKEVKITILEQSHIHFDFSDKGEEGTSFTHKGVKLISACHTAYYKMEWATDKFPREFYVKGTDDEDYETASLTIPLEVYQDFKQAVLAYNETYKD